MGKPDLRALDGVVSKEVLDAMYIASEELTRLGIRHALVGGLAVGAHGWPRATRDVDFLVGPEGFDRHGAIVTFKDGVPIKVGRVAVDPILRAENEEHLDSAIRFPEGGLLPVAPIEALVYMKLRSPRRKDEVDIIELIKAGADTACVLDYLNLHAPDLLTRFGGLVDRARSEE